MSMPAEPTTAGKRRRGPFFGMLKYMSTKLTARPSERERTSKGPSSHTPPEVHSDSTETIDAIPKEVMAYETYTLPVKPEETAANKEQNAKQKRVLKKARKRKVEAKKAEGAKRSEKDEKAKEAAEVEELGKEEWMTAPEPDLHAEHASNESHSNDGGVKEKADSPILEVDADETARRASLQPIIPPSHLTLPATYHSRIVEWLQEIEQHNATASSATQASTLQEAYDAGFHDGSKAEQKNRQDLLETATCEGYEKGQKAAGSINKDDRDVIARQQGYIEGYERGLQQGTGMTTEDIEHLLDESRGISTRAAQADRNAEVVSVLVRKQEEQLKLARAVMRLAVERVRQMGWLGKGSSNGGDSDRDDEDNDHGGTNTADDHSNGDTQMIK
ncbi:hypothetical protein Ptr902_11524 [Pyrenophora tritici-repentis]|nr:hypothetical protein Ptr902_11524 [Pyrenophora tritici-repentis]